MTERTANEIWAGVPVGRPALLRILTQAWETLAIWRQRSRGRAALGSLGARSLQDMGITRADALWESRKPFWRE